jgi:voltage-gated potassium channel
LAEDVGESHRKHSFGDALSWSTATIATVGYGHVAPVTLVGRLVGSVTVVVGISALVVFTAKVAELLVRDAGPPDSERAALAFWRTDP